MTEETSKTELAAMTKDELTAYMASNNIELMDEYQATGSTPTKAQLVESIVAHEQVEQGGVETVDASEDPLAAGEPGL